MPITPRFTWTETPGIVTIQVLLQSASRSKLDVLLTEFYVKVNCPPFFFQADLFADVDEKRSAATIDEEGVTFRLFKKEEVAWERLTAAGERADIFARRQARLDAAREGNKKVKEEAKAQIARLDRLAVEKQMQLEQAKRRIIEERKASELRAEREELEKWQRESEAQNQLVQRTSGHKDRGKGDGGQKRSVLEEIPNSGGNTERHPSSRGPLPSIDNTDASEGDKMGVEELTGGLSTAGQRKRGGLSRVKRGESSRNVRGEMGVKPVKRVSFAAETETFEVDGRGRHSVLSGGVGGEIEENEGEGEERVLEVGSEGVGGSLEAWENVERAGEGRSEVGKDVEETGRGEQAEERPRESGLRNVTPEEKGKSLPAPRQRVGAEVQFTPKVLPSHLPARESREKELLELKKSSGSEDVSDTVDISERAPIFLKDKGDDFYKGGDFASAVNAYTAAIDKDSTMALCFANRAACHLQLGNNTHCIGDCSTALTLLREEEEREGDECVSDSGGSSAKAEGREMVANLSKEEIAESQDNRGQSDSVLSGPSSTPAGTDTPRSTPPGGASMPEQLPAGSSIGEHAEGDGPAQQGRSAASVAAELAQVKRTKRLAAMVRVLSRRAAAHVQCQNLDEAVKDYSEVLRMDPGNCEARSNLDEVLDFILPPTAEVMKRRGDARHSAKEYEHAIAAYTHAISLDPSPHLERVCFSNRALCHFRLEAFDKSLEDCNTALSLLIPSPTHKNTSHNNNKTPNARITQAGTNETADGSLQPTVERKQAEADPDPMLKRERENANVANPRNVQLEEVITSEWKEEMSGDFHKDVDDRKSESGDMFVKESWGNGLARAFAFQLASTHGVSTLNIDVNEVDLGRFGGCKEGKGLGWELGRELWDEEEVKFMGWAPETKLWESLLQLLMRRGGALAHLKQYEEAKGDYVACALLSQAAMDMDSEKLLLDDARMMDSMLREKERKG